ncbi:MAG TPA: alkaline phosphatase family protein [Solirubrobacteraceae bacterium]|nr:alkaline phosphatase family protein [Solirubrobacteraceae bacterium]
MSPERPVLCGECGAPLVACQRYCLMCGTRAGEPSPLLEKLQRQVAAQGAEPEPAATAPASPVGLRLPPPRIAALLVLVFLGFGVLMGGAASSPVQDTLAASARRLKVVLPAAPTPTTSSPISQASTAEGVSSEAQAPESEPAATPEAPATTPAAPVKAPATTTPSTGKHEQAGKEGEGGSPSAPATKLPPIKHVFVVMLSDQPYASVFGPISPAHYLSGTLEKKGTLLVRYDAVAHEELANEIALLSGQGPTAETAANCPTYAPLLATGGAADEQVLGTGCVYPSSTRTLPDELVEKHLTSRAYVEDLGEGTLPACTHPIAGASDPSADQAASTGPYATFRNPFVYFQSIVGGTDCTSEDTGLGQLKSDLASPARTPNFTYIAPDRCHDGNPTPCTPGAPAGLVPADAFLQTVVPEILASKAYKQNGLLVITVDEAPSSGEYADSSSCCGQPQFPNVEPSAATAGLSPRGGGTVGALLLSPYLKGAAANQEPYDHFSLLLTIEDLFGVKHLGYSALPAVKPFEASMFSSGKLG